MKAFDGGFSHSWISDKPEPALPDHLAALIFLVTGGAALVGGALALFAKLHPVK